MCKGIIGKKLGMTAVFTPDGRRIPVTVVQAGPCVITQVKTKSSDGYDALQLGLGSKKSARINKPLAGHMQKAGDGRFAKLKEFAVEKPEKYSLGQTVGCDIFAVGELVDVTGVTKGRGFSGVIKRHGFHGGRKTHGSMSHRIPGSIGCSAWPGRVIKGKKMPGQYGVERKTVRNLQIVDIRPSENLILIKGAVPGAKTGWLEIRKRKFA